MGRPGCRAAKLLLVDASAETRDALEEVLRAAGYDTAVAASGSLAIAMLEWECPDVVISRAKVDDMDGYDLFSRVRSDPTAGDTPFVLLAGRDRSCALAATEAGVDAVLTGDVPLDSVVTRIAELLDRRGGAQPVTAGRRVEREPSQPSEPLWVALERSRTSAPPEAPSFQGSLGVMDLAEVTQAIALGGKTGRLAVALSSGEGSLLFEAGRLVHASFAGRTGENAFGALITRAQSEPQAWFRFSQAERSDLAHAPRTIRRSVDQLLLSIAADIDEDHTRAPLTRAKEG